VFGLESSGTTFVTALLESSVSVRQRINGNQRDNTPALKVRKEYELQHLSLPSGSNCSASIDKKSGEFIIQVVPALFPAHCVHMTKQPITSSVAEKRRRPLTDDCLKLLGNDISQGLDYLYPRRFFVNITSHIMWYRERGVIASAILVVRDQTIGTISRSLEHCPILDRATQEEALGLKLLREAMDVLPRQFSETDVAPLAVLSYETLLTAGVPYLNFVLRSLGLPEVRDTLEGTFNDANKVYIKPREEVEILKRRKDHGRRRPSLLRQDLEAQGGGRPLGLPHNLA
jgi:hypothetical protein